MTNTLPDSVETRAAMIDTCKWMNARGLNQGTSGNISVKTDQGVLITPSGVPYEDLTADMIVTIPLEGAPDDGLPLKPSTEWLFHQKLQQTRPDMAVALHAHPAYCSALAVQRRPIPACHYMVAAFGGSDVPLVDYSIFGGAKLADDLSQALKDRHGALMANHGATVLGETLMRARWRLEELENLARTYLLSHVGGSPHILTEAEMADVFHAFANYGPK